MLTSQQLKELSWLGAQIDRGEFLIRSFANWGAIAKLIRQAVSNMYSVAYQSLTLQRRAVDLKRRPGTENVTDPRENATMGRLTSMSFTELWPLSPWENASGYWE